MSWGGYRQQTVTNRDHFFCFLIFLYRIFFCHRHRNSVRHLCPTTMNEKVEMSPQLRIKTALLNGYSFNQKPTSYEINVYTFRRFVFALSVVLDG